jgi:tetratricopeptide (TPR) repeat protein
VGTVPTTSALHQLPSPPGDFTGREEELAALRFALAKGGTGAIFGLRGTGGIGKTVLALKLAEELEDLYPDAQFYLDLQGVTQPLTPAQAMVHVIHAYQLDARLPDTEAELAGLYRSVLHGKRTLLLMDNAASREQVEPLIPPSGSLLLVTSRFHFALPGLISRDLDELPLKDARRLLLKIARRIGNEANTLAQLCGRLPLALRLAGSALAERPDLSPTEYTRRLKEGKERFEPVEASLNLSYELLNEEQQRLWPLLAVFPGTFTARAAATVLGLEFDPAAKLLGDLVRSSLLEWEDKDERYRLHDLARSFADQRLGETERGAAQKRHAEYFLLLLWVTHDLYLKGGESLDWSLRLFDADWINVQEGFAWAASRFLEDEAAAKICDDYPNAGTFLLALRQHPRERIRWREIALAAARRVKNRGNEGAHVGNLGLAYMALGEPRRAMELYEQWLTIAREIGNRQAESAALGNLGNAYHLLGEPRRTIEHFEQALDITREIADRQLEGKALGSLGNAYAKLGERRRAVEFYEQALAIAQETGDRLGEGVTLGNLGLTYVDLDEPHRAIEFFERRLAIAREIGDRRGEAKTSWDLAWAVVKEGDRARAAGWPVSITDDLARAADLMQVLVNYEYEIGHPNAEENAAFVASVRAYIAEQGS